VIILFSFVILFGSISATITANALTSNALTSNALTSNALLSNALTSNALTSNALTSNAITGSAVDPNENTLAVLETNSLETLALLMKEVPWNITLSLVPELMQYFVGCALDSGQIWNMTYNNTGYSYNGSLGIAPSDLSTPLTPEQAKWISACLLARVNYFEHHVLISIRGSIFSTSPEEEDQYNVYEGYFSETYLLFHNRNTSAKVPTTGNQVNLLIKFGAYVPRRIQHPLLTVVILPSLDIVMKCVRVPMVHVL